jgi:hypothetical protein
MLMNIRFYLNTLVAIVMAGLVYAIIILLPFQRTNFANINMAISATLLFINYFLLSYQFFKKETMTQKFLSVPLIRVLFSFFGLYFILFFLYTYLPLPVYVILITYFVILLINTYTFYRIYLATSIIKTIEQKQTNANEFINEFSKKLMAVEATVLNSKVKQKIRAIREDLKYTTPLSQPSVKSIEQALIKLLESSNFNDLDENEVNSVINQITSLIENRQLLLKK